MREFFKNKQVLIAVGVMGSVVAIAFTLEHLYGRAPNKQSSRSTPTSQTAKSSQSNKTKSRSDVAASSKDTNDSKALEDVKSPEKSKGSTSGSSSASDSEQASTKGGQMIGSVGDTKRVNTNPNAGKKQPVQKLPEGDSDRSSKGYTDDSVKAQSQEVDKNPKYINSKDYVLGIAPVTIADKQFSIGMNRSLNMYIEKSNESYTFVLTSPLDWALFQGQIGLSDDEYAKVVKYYNTTLKYIEDNHIQIIGTGG